MALDTTEGADETRAEKRARQAAEAAEATAAAEAAAKKPQEPTDYVVLRHVEFVPMTDYSKVIVTPVDKPTQALYASLQDGVWVQVHRTTARTQAAAIEEHTGEGEHANPGIYRAVSYSAWKGAMEVKSPRQVALDVREPIE